MNQLSTGRRIAMGACSLLLATALWLPCLHLLYRVDARGLLDASGVHQFTRELAARHLALWNDPAARDRELQAMRRSNAEWDFMGRTYLVLALANMALRDPALKPGSLVVIDAILEETLRLEQEHGFYHFSMPYARSRPYKRAPARSLFVDGEIALMVAARRFLEEKESHKLELGKRVALITDGMAAGPLLSAESYPDECWTFDNANALAALRLADALDGTDHRDFCQRWTELARRKLVHPGTGILVSEYTLEGETINGPEGSTIWMVAHALQLVDPELARDQYDRARRELRRSILGFDVSREWPPSARGQPDIDSGVVIPLIDASPAASGLALVGAAAFGDAAHLEGLLRSLELAAFPIREGGALQYAASNQVGDAVLLYATTLGPLWMEALRRNAR